MMGLTQWQQRCRNEVELAEFHANLESQRVNAGWENASEEEVYRLLAEADRWEAEYLASL